MGAVDYSWYNLRAKNWNPDDHEGGYGMMTSDFHPRASYCSFSALAGLVGECLEVLRLPSSRYRYFFTLKPSAKGFGKVMIFWDEDVVDSSWRLKIKTDAKHVHAVDLMGNRRKLECKDGIVEVEVSRRPAAIVFDDVSAVEPDAAALAAPRQGETPLEVIVRGLNDKAPPDVELSDRALVHDCYEAQFGYHDQLWKGAADLSAKVWFGRKAQGPYSIAVACELGIDVKDDIHTPGANKKAAGDSVLAALAFPGQNGHWIIHLADGADDGANAEFKRVPRGFEISEASKTLIATVERIGNITRYRLVVPLSTLKASWSSDFCKGFRFNLLVRDDDGKGVESWIEPRPETFRNADPRRFALIKYVRRKSSPESVSGSRKK
jgi:hypothetical protein